MRLGRHMSVPRQVTIAGGLLQLRARRIHKIKNRLKAASGLFQRVTGDNHARAAMPFALVIKRKFDFNAFRKPPLREETNSLRRPLHLLIGKVDGIGKTDGDSLALVNS